MRQNSRVLIFCVILALLVTFTFLNTANAQLSPEDNPAELQGAKPTRTPRPTSTPVPIPPPAEPLSLNLMILFGLLAVIIVLIGVWINRKKPNDQKGNDQ
jgi:hypothetical protein